jgi:PRTRC genetic system protein E
VFVELMPVLADRTVMITVARLNDDAIRVNVIPQRTGENENVALQTPFSITGTPADLDAELSIHLLGYVDSHLQLRTRSQKQNPRWTPLPRPPRRKQGGRRRNGRRNGKERALRRRRAPKKRSRPSRQSKHPQMPKLNQRRVSSEIRRYSRPTYYNSKTREEECKVA